MSCFCGQTHTSLATALACSELRGAVSFPELRDLMRAARKRGDPHAEQRDSADDPDDRAAGGL